MFSWFMPKVVSTNENDKNDKNDRECQTCRRLRTENSVLRKQIEILLKEKLNLRLQLLNDRIKS